MLPLSHHGSRRLLGSGSALRSAKQGICVCSVHPNKTETKHVEDSPGRHMPKVQPHARE